MSKSVTIHGGQPTPPLPPEPAFDGTPNPEIGRAIAEGQTRYHLDTLAQLDAESRAAIEAVARETGKTPERVVEQTIDVMRAAEARGTPATGCMSAGCRTLLECLCSCRRCRAACAPRKR